MSTVLEQLPPLIQNLLKADSFPHPCSEIELVETHISWVLLTGDFVYKIKKPVNFGFLDFSTLEKRRQCCFEELRLNSRTAPEVYLSIEAISKSETGPKIGGDGPVIEYAVKMKQFRQENLLDKQLEEGRLTSIKMDLLAKAIANFHSQIAVATDNDQFGSPEHVQMWALENFEQLENLIRDPERCARIAKLKDWTVEQFQDLKQLMSLRKKEGFIRECHGDLHLRNITEIEGAMIPFDGIEFNPDIRWIDVINELAFLFTDLEHRKREDLAWRVLNAYLEETGDYDGLALFAYYRLYRIMVRAKVDSLRLHQVGLDEQEKEELEADIDIYLEQGEKTIEPRRVRMVLMRGLSGSGKTTISQSLLEHMGMIRIRSDVERKRLFHLKPESQTSSPVGGGIYSKDISHRTFQELQTICRSLSDAGIPMIVDATFLDRSLVETFRDLSVELETPFVVLDLLAPEAVLRERIEARSRSGSSASEANQEVLTAQLQKYHVLEKPYSIKVDGVAPPDVRALRNLIEHPE